MQSIEGTILNRLQPILIFYPLVVQRVSRFKKISFIVILLLLLSPYSYAGSGEMNGIWNLKRDYLLDGKLQLSRIKSHMLIFNAHHNRFTGNYVGIDNDSIFYGEILKERITDIIYFIQYDSSYYRVFAGKKVKKNKFIGTWYAVDGHTGDFVMVKKK
jgi:hypothetical protein